MSFSTPSTRSTVLPPALLLWFLLTQMLSASSPATDVTPAAIAAPDFSGRLPAAALAWNPRLALPGPLDSNDVDTNNYPADPIISNIVIPGLTLLVGVPIHELGHFVMAHAFGSKSVSMEFFPDNSGGVPAIAVTYVDTEGLSSTEIGVIAISGVGASRLMAETLDRVSRGFDTRMTYPTFAQKLTSALFIFGRMDFPLYLVSDMFTNLGQRPGGDFDILVTEIAGRATLPRVGAYLGLLAVAAIDIYFDLDRIGYHYSIFNDRQVPHPSTSSSLRLGVVRGALGASYSFSF